jgi:integrase
LSLVTPVFSTSLGLVYEPRTYEDLFKRTLKSAGVSNINFHAHRHTFATRALEAGMDIKVLSSILGHAQASTTLNLYAHALPDHKKTSMYKMEIFYKTMI